MPDFAIRPARREDIPNLARFLVPFVEAERLLPRTLTELDELYRHFFLAESEGRLIGCAALEIYSPKLAELRSLAVLPELRQHGIGRALVEACLERARKAAVLEVMAISSRENFFLNCGFDFTLPGEKKAFFYAVSEALSEADAQE